MEADQRPGVTPGCELRGQGLRAPRCPKPERSVAVGTADPPPGLPGTRPAGTPLPGPDVAPPTELPREPQPLPPASPPPPGCSFRFQKGIYCRSFWAQGSGGGSARTLGVAIRAERSGPRLPRGDFAQQPEGNAVLIGTGARRESGHARPRVVFRMLGETGSERPQPLRVRARVTSTPGRPEARGPVLPAEAPAPNRPPYGSRRPLSACQNSTAPSQSEFQRSSAFMGCPSSSEWTSFPPALLGGGARW